MTLFYSPTGTTWVTVALFVFLVLGYIAHVVNRELEKRDRD